MVVQRHIENLRFIVLGLLAQACQLACSVVAGVHDSWRLIFDAGVPNMIKRIFEAIEAMLRAAIYLLILLMGLAMVGLGAFTILCLAIRTGQLLWTLLFREPWL